MTRNNSNSEDVRAQNEHQHGWEHIPSNDNDEIVSPISYVPPTSTARSPPQFRREPEPEPHSSDNVSVFPSKEPNGPYEVEILDAAPRLKKRRFLTEWWQEMLSAMSSIFCVVAIVVILYKVNGKPLADWDEPVSLNAVISVLSTAVKAGLILPVAECISQLKWIHLQSSKSHLEQLQVFDNASRGPAGSFQFFFQARRAPLVSYFACLIVILAVALDPFTQQIIQYYQSYETPIPNLNSTVRHSQAYDRGPTYGTNMENRRSDDSIMFGMLSGLYGTLPVPPFSCPNANCTYPEVTSLGVCNSCEDVTERTVADCTIIPWDHGLAGNYSWCNYTLPGGFIITANNTMSEFGWNYPTLNTSTSKEPKIYPDDVNSSVRNLTRMDQLYNMSFVRFDSAEDLGGVNRKLNGTDWMKTMTAHECLFRLCAWSFTNWTHNNGALQEGSVAQSLLGPQNETLENWQFQRVPNVNLVNYVPFGYVAKEPDFPGNHTFEVSFEDRRAMVQTFYAMWDRATANEAATYFTNSLYMADRNISRTLDAMARGITYKMMSGPNATESLGQVFKTETFIRVYWQWLALTIVTVVSSVALLAATIVKTGLAHQRAWKSSLTPLLYADSTMAAGKNGWRDWGEEDKVQRKAVISTGLLSASAVGAASALSR